MRWQGSLILQYNKLLDIGNSDNKETKNLCLVFIVTKCCYFLENPLRIILNLLCRYKSYLQKFYCCNVPENVRRQSSKFIVGQITENNYYHSYKDFACDRTTNWTHKKIIIGGFWRKTFRKYRFLAQLFPLISLFPINPW